MFRIVAALLLAACALSVTGQAQADVLPPSNPTQVIPGPIHPTNPGSVLPGPVHHTNLGPFATSTTFGCQYDVTHGTVTAFGYWRTVWSNGVVTSSTDGSTGRHVRARVTSRSGSSVVLDGHTANGVWQHHVWRNYTTANVKVMVSGHHCTAT
jgi:hypothetical protein